MPRKRKSSDDDCKTRKNTIESFFKKPTPKKARIVIDSDEEDDGKPKQKSIDSFFKTPSPETKSELNNNSSSSKRTPVTAKDFFGTSSVSRKEKPAVKRKIEEIDLEEHDDEDFEKTLLQLDTNSPAKKTKKSSETEEVKLSPLKEDFKKLDDEAATKDKSRLASKLSSRMKNIIADTPEPQKKKNKNEVVVPDTPEIKKVSPKKKSLYKMEIVKSPQKSKNSEEHHKEQSHKEMLQKSNETPKSKKPSPKKTSPASNSSTSPQEETEKKKGAGYRSYLHREGPRALGSKEIPEGGENCLDGLVFVITGVLESLERDEAKSLIEKYSGKVSGSLSRKTNYIVLGRDCGQSKLEKARSFGTKQLDEDGLLDLIKSRPGRKSKCELKAEESFKKEKSFSKKLENFQKTEEKVEKMTSSSSSPRKMSEKPAESIMLVDKYKPTSLKNIIGQQGDRSNARKLLHWLTNWHRNQAAGVKPQGKFFGKDDGAGLKAALLSGPPGIGKTTTATLVCQEAGFSFVELNASDTRSKKSLQQEVSEALNNETLIDFMGPKKSSAHGHKHCLVMDEVDGMAGNEDRGGLQALVQLVKTTKIPIICMCNDRNHQKMRTLSNYCFDLRFQRPRLEQIKAAMMSMSFKENLKIPAPALNEIIQAANHDIRQVIHNISMWTSGNKSITYEQAKKDSSSAKKDLKIGPFDVCRKVFVGGEETAGMTLVDKSDLFFHDYSFAPLFVQENYPHVLPYSTSGNLKRHLSLLSRTADSICDGDLTDKKIRTEQMWSLLPAQAIYASVLPGEFMRGSFPQMVTFPAWLGKNSSRTKTERILQELRTHMRLKVSAEKRSLNMDYLPYLRRGLTDPLLNQETQGVPEVIKLMDEYDIIKEDFDNILEVTKWPNSRDPMASLSSSTKAAFTRSYNKEVHLTPYSTGNVTKKRRGGGGPALEEEMVEENGDGAGQPESEEEKDNIELDTMIKVKKKTAAKGKTAAKEKTSAKSSSEGKGKGKGRGRGKEKS